MLGKGVTDILGGSHMARGAPFSFKAIVRRLLWLAPAAFDARAAFFSWEARRAEEERHMVSLR